MIYKYCRRCGKRLKGEENRIRGFGRICYEKVKKEVHVDPLIFTPIEQTQRQIERLKMQEQALRAEAEQASRARANLEARQEQSRAERRGKAKSKAEQKTPQGAEQRKSQGLKSEGQGAEQESKARQAEQEQKEQESREARQEARAEGKPLEENLLKENQNKSKGGKGVIPSHLEKTLTPTRKKPLLFTPHTRPPTPYI